MRVLISVSVARTTPHIVENYPKESDYCSLIVDKKTVLQSSSTVVE
jgi:hypothetical protein